MTLVRFRNSRQQILPGRKLPAVWRVERDARFSMEFPYPRFEQGKNREEIMARKQSRLKPEMGRYS